MSPTTEQEIQPAKLFSTCYTPFGNTAAAPVILIHGLFSSNRTWNPVKCKLGDRTKRTIFTYDLRNHGKSEFIDDNILEIESDVADLKNFMDTKNIRRAILVAHSIGSRIAMAFALKYENMVEMLVLEDMSLTDSSNINNSFRNAATVVRKMSHLCKSLPPSCSEEEAQRKIIKFVKSLTPELPNDNDQSNFNLQIPIHKDFKTNKFIWDVNVKLCTEMETRSSIYSLELEKQESYSGDALFITGDHSAFSIDHDKELISKHFPNARSQNFGNGFHAFHQENPENFLRMVGDFINTRE